MKQQKYARAMTVLALLTVVNFAHAQKAKTATSSEMMTKLEVLDKVDKASGAERINLETIGKSVKGKPIPMVTIVHPEADKESVKKLFIICRQHGNEPAPTEAMLKLIVDLATAKDESTIDILKKVAFYIVPMVNPDGADRDERRNANGVDLNRDWLLLTQPEIQAVRAAIDSVAPDVLIDQHELSPGNKTTDFIESAGIASGACKEVVEESARLQYLVIGMLRTHEMTVRSCQIEDKNPARLAHRYFPIIGGMKTLLFETNQQGIRQYMLVHRMRTHIVGTMTVAKYLAGQAEELNQRIVSHDEWRRSVQLASRKGKTANRSNIRK